MHALAYGARYGALLLVDTLLFSWHGFRPLSWQREFLGHRFASPIVHCGNIPTGQDFQALRVAQAMYPDRTVYLGLGSRYSPWYGKTFFHEVKVLVGSGGDGAPPKRTVDGYGIPLEQFRRLPWGKSNKHLMPIRTSSCPALCSKAQAAGCSDPSGAQ